MAQNRNIETSLTLDYRKTKWGIERIVLDGIANHMPADSKGTEIKVEIKQNGGYVDFREADPSLNIEEITFSDNGIGYDAELLSVLFSTKTADALSVGQHGEGLKLVASAALRGGVDIEYRSRNWTAVPYKKPETIGGNRFDRLCFQIAINGDHVNGSRTIIKNPSAELVAETLTLPEKVLHFNKSYEDLYTEGDCQSLYGGKITNGHFNYPLFFNQRQRYKSKIIDLNKGKQKLFVKGFKVQDLESIFSYDLGIEDISPDRVNTNLDELNKKIKDLLVECNEPKVLERILFEAGQHPNGTSLEFQVFAEKPSERERLFEIDYMMDRKTDTKLDELFKYKIKENPWITAFKKVYGENAVLASSDTNINNDAKLLGFSPIEINYSIQEYLSRLGVLRACQLERNKEYKWISLEDLTKDEREVLEMTSKIAEKIGEPPPEVRIYSGLFLQTGREIESALGVQISEQNGRKYIGIKREGLKSLRSFAETLVHELGHHSTNAGDSDRRFADYFVCKLAQRAIDDISSEKEREGTFNYEDFMI